MANLGNIVYLTKLQYETLRTNGSITVGDVTYTYNANDLYLIPDENHIYKHNLAITFTYRDDGSLYSMTAYGYIINNSATEIVKTDLIDLFANNAITFINTSNTPSHAGILNYSREQPGVDNYTAVLRLAPVVSSLSPETVTLIDQNVTDNITAFTDTITQLL